MLLIAVVILGVKINLMSLLFAIPLMALICMALVSLGVALASMIEDMQGFHLIMNFLVMPMFFLSGALFPLNNSPQLLQYLSYLDPLTYAVESLRYLLLGTSNMPITISVSVIVVFFVATNLWAAYMFGKIED
jgi:ABC-2 type transport system permease protein